MIMSRPRMSSTFDRLRGLKRDIHQPADSTFGY
jgi:hypothetical protein